MEKITSEDGSSQIVYDERAVRFDVCFTSELLQEGRVGAEWTLHHKELFFIAKEQSIYLLFVPLCQTD